MNQNSDTISKEETSDVVQFLLQFGATKSHLHGESHVRELLESNQVYVIPHEGQPYLLNIATLEKLTENCRVFIGKNHSYVVSFERLPNCAIQRQKELQEAFETKIKEEFA